MNNNFTVVIPSKSATNISACLTAVWKNEPKCHVVVINDGIEFRDLDLKIGGFLTVVDGVKPFVYSRNINIGINAAPESDTYVLLNDDALLQSPGGFTALWEAAHNNRDFGIVSATTNVSGSLEQRPQNIGFRTANAFLPFVCVLIPHRTIERVGYLDEDFIHFGWEDNDYCHRAQLAGYQLGVHDGCYVDHGSLSSSFRGKSKLNPKQTNRATFEAKWGKGRS